MKKKGNLLAAAIAIAIIIQIITCCFTNKFTLGVMLYYQKFRFFQQEPWALVQHIFLML